MDAPQQSVQKVPQSPPPQPGPSSPVPPLSPEPPITYVVKRFLFKGKKVAVAMQNMNGPCPLLSVANALALRGHFSIHDDKAVVTADELLAAISDYLFDANSAASEDFQGNHERNVNDVITMLPKTLVGIDVNVKFDSITSFEFTAESILFDFCNVRLVHGWLVDPQDPNYASIRKLSYNHLVELEIAKQGMDAMTEKMKDVNISPPSSSDTVNTTSTTDESNSVNNNAETKSEQPSSSIAANPENDHKIVQALLAERFLTESATQLTYYGLTELHSGIKEDELCVFFRNNHFNTLYKHEGELYLLVTDQGYANTPVVWEKLCQIDGDSVFLTYNFAPYQPTSPELALAIDEHEHQNAQHDTDRDLALALQLQEEEHQRQQQHAPPPEVEQLHRKHRKEKKDKSCSIQ